MRLTNNFNFFKEILDFNNEDEFYFIQILLNKKDGHAFLIDDNKNKLIKSYTVRSIDDFCKLESEIKNICDLLNARAYIYPTKRSFCSIANEMLIHTTDLFLCKNNILNLQNLYNSVCSRNYIGTDEKFIVNLNKDNVDNIVEYVNYIDLNCDPIISNKFLYKIFTVNGAHLITLPFNIVKFKERYPDVDIRKNSPTLLYY